MNAMAPERSPSSLMRPKLGQYELIVRKWLEDDRSIAPKQRHTGTRVWQRLVDECQADVSVSAVRVMVKALRAEIDLPVPTAMIPQLHLPGKRPDVDFGDVLVYVNGEKIKAKMFAMRLSHSGKAFHMVYSGESRRVLF